MTEYGKNGISGDIPKILFMLPLKEGESATGDHVLVTEEFLSDTNKSAIMHGKLNEPSGRDATAKFSTTGFIDNEYAGLSILHKNGVHVPEPISLVKRDEVPSRGIIMSRIHGKIFSDVSSPENRHLLGREVRKANEIVVPGFGLIIEGIPQFMNAGELIESEIAAVSPHIQPVGNAATLLSELWGVVKEDVKTQQPRFTHRDLKGRNVMVTQSGDVTLLDLEYWGGGDPLLDVGGFLAYTIRSGKQQLEFDDFFRGYMNGKEPTDAQKLRILFYSVLSAGKFMELVSRVHPANINYAIDGLRKATSFVEGKLK